MWLSKSINRRSIIAYFLEKKYGTQNELILDKLTYSIKIRIKEQPLTSIKSIQSVTIGRKWNDEEENPENYAWIGKNKTIKLNESCFDPVYFDYSQENKMRSLSVISILALKCLYDRYRGFKLPGLIFRSEIYALRELGIWPYDKNIDRLVSQIARESSTLLDPKNKDCGKPSFRADKLPLADRFLLDNDEIYNIICWQGKHGKGKKQELFEAAYTINIKPRDIHLLDIDGNPIPKELIKVTLQPLFPPMAILSADKIQKYQKDIKNEKYPLFNPVNFSKLAKEKKKDRLALDINTYEKEKNWYDKKSKLCDRSNPFKNIFIKHDTDSYIDREWLSHIINEKIANSSPEWPYILLTSNSGFGKTAFIVNFIKHLRIDYVCYFFDKRDPTLKHPKFFLAHIIYEFEKILKIDEHSAYVTISDMLNRYRVLLELIEEWGKSTGNTLLLIIDALDEAFDDSIEGISVGGILMIHIPHNMRLIISSQWSSYLESFINQEYSNVVDLTRFKNESNKDIRKYFLSALSKADIYSTKDIDYLVGQSGGNFLYTTLISDLLNEGNKNIDDLLTYLPKSLESVYELQLNKMFERIRKLDILRHVRKAIRIITHVTGKLNKNIVRECLNVDSFELQEILKHLLPFIDSSELQEDGICCWHHWTLFWFFLNSKHLTPQETQETYEIIGQGFLKTITNGNTLLIPESDINLLPSRYVPIDKGRTDLLRLIRDYAFSQICENSLVDSVDQLILECRYYALCNNHPEYLVFFGFVDIALNDEKKHAEDNSFIGHVFPSNMISKVTHIVDQCNSVEELLDSTIALLSSKSINETELTWLLNRAYELIRPEVIIVDSDIKSLKIDWPKMYDLSVYHSKRFEIK